MKVFLGIFVAYGVTTLIFLKSISNLEYSVDIKPNLSASKWKHYIEVFMFRNFSFWECYKLRYVSNRYTFKTEMGCSLCNLHCKLPCGYENGQSDQTADQANKQTILLFSEKAMTQTQKTTTKHLLVTLNFRLIQLHRRVSPMTTTNFI